MASPEQTYVYENVEVVKTGRTASKKLTSGKDNVLYEITPKDERTGTWKKWVSDAQLHKVNIN